MRPKFQSKQEVLINAPVEKVWEYMQDLSKIVEFHPRVNKVDFVSGKQYREAGVAYQCHLIDGKNTCLEKDLEIVPMEKIATVLPEDTMGLSKILTDYLVETIFTKVDEKTTKMEFYHFYSSSTLKVKLIKLFALKKIARESQDTLNAIKKAIEDKI
jgi:hypothetical protein